MTAPIVHQPDPRLDLVFERVVEVSAEHLWRGWTVEEQLKKWFTPAPWKTVDCEIDLRPGGKFRTAMRGPEGQEFDNVGCYLEIVPHRKLVWTGALGPGYRPRSAGPAGSFVMTAVITLQPQGAGTLYTALVIHGDEESRKAHEKMGFYEGWGKALDQLVALA
ncbi:MAG: SRPBCC family protein [Steroidobacteraceae bacterium]